MVVASLTQGKNPFDMIPDRYRPQVRERVMSQAERAIALHMGVKLMGRMLGAE
jgi:hypothetical protein